MRRQPPDSVLHSLVSAVMLVAFVLVAIAMLETFFPRRVTPTVAPTATPMAYTAYLPMLMRPPGLWGVGIASIAGGKYNEQLGADWWYVWGFCDAPDCVPMTRDWSLPRACPQFLLVGNEPNSQEPYGFPIEPEQAASVSKAIRATCPQSWLITGNVALPEFLGIPGIEWTRRYIDAGGEYDQLGAHCYASPNGNANQCVQALTDFTDAFLGARVCVTETGTFNRRIEIHTELIEWVASHFGCWAEFTDYDPSPFYGANLNMVNGDGTLNEFGIAFRERAHWWMR